jgi:predicted dehydrogenase
MASNQQSNRKITRRQFAAGALGMSASAILTQRVAFAQGSETLGIGWIGTGTRGTADMGYFLRRCSGVKLVAMADMYSDRIKEAREKVSKFKDKVSVTDDDCYLGLDAYRKLLARDDVDIVVDTGPPGFRPQHVLAAVEAGKHVFAEKPGGVDPVALRQLEKAGKRAEEQGLSIVVGTQQRRMKHYQALMQRVRDGQIGEIVAADVAWHWGSHNWHYHPREKDFEDLEWQIRSWPYHRWLSGDHVVEQHLHNLDFVNWAIGMPKNCHALGGRISRTDPSYGNIYDHFSAQFEYENGIRLYSAASQIKGSTHDVHERLLGTKGVATVDRSQARIEGQKPWEYDKETNPGTGEQFVDLVHSIRKREPINEAQDLADATFMAIAERMSAYTGRLVNLDWVRNASKLSLKPTSEQLRAGRVPVSPVAIPGETKLQ